MLGRGGAPDHNTVVAQTDAVVSRKGGGGVQSLAKSGGFHGSPPPLKLGWMQSLDHMWQQQTSGYSKQGGSLPSGRWDAIIPLHWQHVSSPNCVLWRALLEQEGSNSQPPPPPTHKPAQGASQGKQLPDGNPMPRHLGKFVFSFFSFEPLRGPISEPGLVLRLPLCEGSFTGAPFPTPPPPHARRVRGLQRRTFSTSLVCTGTWQSITAPSLHILFFLRLACAS